MKISIKQALRRIRSSLPAGLAIIVLVALAVGAATATFSVANDLLVKDLPYPDSSRLVLIWEKLPLWDLSLVPARIPTYLAVKDQARSLDGVCLFHPQRVSVTGLGTPLQTTALYVSDGFFEMLGVNLVAGRSFLQSEHKRGSDQVVMISESLWRSRMGGRPRAIGSRIILDQNPATIVGIVPSSFRFPNSQSLQGFENRAAVDFWKPILFDGAPVPRQLRNWNDLMLGRISSSSSQEQVEVELQTILNQLNLQYPGSHYEGGSLAIANFKRELVGQYTKPLAGLSAGVLLFLLIGTLNVSTLLLTRSSALENEFAIRLALGANRSGVFSSLLAETTMLMVAGAAGGLLIAWGLLKSLGLVVANYLPRLVGLTFDWQSFLLACTLVGVSSLMFGVLPSVLMIRPDFGARLTGAIQRMSTSGSTLRTLSVILVLQVSLAATLLYSVGLLTRSFSNLMEEDAGFDSSDVLTMRLNLVSQLIDRLKFHQYLDDVLMRVDALADVSTAGFINDLPLVDNRNISDTSRYGALPDGGIKAEWRGATPNYFQAMRIPLISGRVFEDRDRASGTRIAVVSDVLAQTLWPDENPIGKRFKRGTPSESAPWYSVIGVVGSIRHAGLDHDPRPQVYRPHFDALMSEATLVVKTRTNPTELLRSVQSAVWGIDSDVPISRIRTMDEVVGDSVAERSFVIFVSGTTSIIALVLAVIGVISLVLFWVQQESHSIGVRKALGARTEQVVRSFVWRALIRVSVGLLAGLVIGRAVGHALDGWLYETEPWDWLVAIGVCAFVLVGGVGSSWMGARRCAHLDPVRILSQK